MHSKSNTPLLWKHSRSALLLLGTVLLMSSCYSVRITNVTGSPEPDPLNNSDGFYRGKLVVELDTTVKIGVLDNEVMALERCPSGGFHSVEYRTSFGGLMKSFLSFGKKRKIQVKYVCLKK